MPYAVGQGHGCPAEKPWAVYNQQTGRVAGCHATKDGALAQMKALYANVTDAASEDRAEWDTAYINALPDSAFAYIEPGGSKDSEGKTEPRSLRHFPHHSSGGAPDPAHVRNALARIPQSNVSDAAKAQATSHVEAHAKALGIGDGDEKAAPQYERRAFEVELRAEARHRGALPTIVGHAAVFNSLSEDLGGFRERIARGAFERTLREGGPVYALWNHNPDYIIASTKNATLRLSEDKAGLLAEMDPLDTPTIRDLVVKPIQDGMVTKMSFGFTAVRDEMTSDDLGPVRVLRDVDLFDVSPVTFPAYSGTDVQSRVSAIIGRLERQLPLSDEDRRFIKIVTPLLIGPAESQESSEPTSAGAGALAAIRERELLLKRKR